MSELNLPDTTPQFTTAEYSGATGNDRCTACKQPITARYYRVNNKMACESCVEQLKHQLPQDSHASYVRGILFGVGAAIVGMILYAGFTILTGFYIGYVSLAVGWLVGKAIMLGSKGIGGRQYQIAAVALTYAAVSLAAIPIALSYNAKEKADSQSAHSMQQQPSSDAQAAQPDQTPPEPKPSIGAALVKLLLIGLASPFLEMQDPVHGIIGLVILIVGIRIAWKITLGQQTAEIQGPYENSAAASV
jgi:uncharacterized protein (DUF983 family)